MEHECRGGNLSDKTPARESQCPSSRMAAEEKRRSRRDGGSSNETRFAATGFKLMEGRRFYAKPALLARPDAAAFYRRQWENSEIHLRRNCCILRNEALKGGEKEIGLFLLRAY